MAAAEACFSLRKHIYAERDKNRFVAYAGNRAASRCRIASRVRSAGLGGGGGSSSSLMPSMTENGESGRGGGGAGGGGGGGGDVFLRPEQRPRCQQYV